MLVMWIGFAVFALCALLFAGIGICQFNAKKPVGFYSGVKPPEIEQEEDVKGWNRGHGLMWMIYGMILFLTGVSCLIFGESFWITIIMMGAVILPFPFIAMIHHHLEKKYVKA